MTEEQIEQKAEEKYCKGCKWRMEQCLWAWRKVNGKNDPNIKNCSCKEVPAYIDGYHEGFKDCAKSRLNTTTISDCPIKDEWHDLRKDPTDLPPKMVSNPNFSIEVLSDKGEIVNYNFHFCEWYYWRSGKPIAWCEIPKWKESE